MPTILGLNAFHGDSSACLVAGGRLLAAVEEERFRRVKHWAGFPSAAVAWCLQERGLSLSDIQHVAINSDPSANWMRRLGYALASRSGLQRVAERLRHARRRYALRELLEHEFPRQRFRGRIHRVEHHLAHLASAFLVAPFPEAVAVSVDGFGDFASAAWGLGRHARIRVGGRVHFPHSLGIFYQALTQYLGFPAYGDEYKVMGLAPYGEPRYRESLAQVLRPLEDGTFRLGLEFFRHHREPVAYRWEGGEPSVGPLFSGALEGLLGPRRRPQAALEQRHKDIACSVQAAYEGALLNLLNRLHDRYRVDNLVLAGGCALNSVANGRIRAHTPFARLYVQPAAGDAGGAIGAALAVRERLGSARPRFVMEHAYWGPEYGTGEIGALLSAQRPALSAARCEVERLTDERILCRRAAQAIADGLVVGWFQGRMEWGARALGNRSIVCDPRRADMRDVLNAKIKRRERFRPFAPSVLRHAVRDWFEVDDDVPFMMKVYPIRAERRAQIPAVTHVDGSGRLQTVERHVNPRFYALIEAYERITGIPMLLNTSFNENEPIVCRPLEALDCFLRTRMDVLVMGDYLIRREPPIAGGAPMLRSADAARTQ